MERSILVERKVRAHPVVGHPHPGRAGRGQAQQTATGPTSIRPQAPRNGKPWSALPRVKSELPLSGRDAYDGPIANDQRDERGAMELYTAGTGNGQRAAIAVNECGVRCTMHVLNLAQGDQRKSDYLKINPTARIPTLIDPDGPGGKPLTLIQSWAILYYWPKRPAG